jgi:putative FmdB family regulatory protein
MPTYEYACNACGSEWEEVQRITAPPLEVCPTCGKSSAHRLISAGTGFILKGGGWYSDLYSSAKPPSNKADAKEGGASDAAGKTDATAPAAATEGGSKKDAPAKAEAKTPAASTPAPTTPTSSTPASSG